MEVYTMPQAAIDSEKLWGMISGAVLVLILVWNWYSARWPRKRNDNGIRVGQPKVYDNRSLSMMLEQLENQLLALQRIDSGTVAGALGTQQATRSASLDASGNFTFTPQPTASTPSKDGSGTVAKGNTPNGSSSDAKANSDDSAGAPTKPFKWSERAADLLSDQVNLSYQIFSLRLTLERAISDRVLEDTEKARVQAVIGFPVSIDPPWFAIGCAGTVEVELTLRTDQEGQPSQPGLSLVALFPQEETYNTWSVNRRQFQLGAAGSYGGVSGGSSGSAATERSSIQRQADIVALEREATAVDGEGNAAPDRNGLIVAWQFRPSAGERRVAAGLRQLLAVISLPKPDQDKSIATMQMRVRSFWEPWERRSGLGWRALLSERPTGHIFPKTGQSFKVCTTEKLEHILRPSIDRIDWYRVGSKKAAVVVSGKNFFTGTKVLMGDTVLRAENGGVTIKSQKTLEIDAPLSALLHDAVLSGRYGLSTVLEVEGPVDVPKLKISNAWIDPKPGNQSYVVRIELTPIVPSVLKWEEFVKLPDPILAINGKVVPDVLLFYRTSEGDNPITLINARVSVTSDFIPDSPILVVRWPFYGEDWLLNYQTSFSRLSISAFRFTSGNQTTVLLSGRNFSGEVKVIADKPYAIDPRGPLFQVAADLLKLELSSEIVDSNPEFFVCETDAPSIAVRVPPKQTALPKLDLSKKPPIIKVKADSVIDFHGTGLDIVTTALFGKDVLKCVAYAGGNSLSVIIKGSLITLPGIETITFPIDAAEPLTAPVLVLSADTTTQSEQTQTASETTNTAG
jgi:hypothetical protein